MGLFKKDETDILDKRLIKSQEFNDELILKNKKLHQELINEFNMFKIEKTQLELDKELFKKERECAFKVADSRYEHLEKELDFIKEHRMLPAECKFYTKMPRTPSAPKKLKKIKR